MAALLCDLQPGDEVIVPSFAFPTTASAFARCGASVVFVDVDPLTMTIDAAAAASAITPRTRVIVALHYAGVPCDMDRICQIAADHGAYVVEDAAQAIFSRYRGKPCGSIGTFGCLSFHESKNVHCGEGGALIVNDAAHVDCAEIIWEKGTDRRRFMRGQVDKYTWQALGSSYVLSELNSAFLLAQLENGELLTANRLRSWNEYHSLLRPLVDRGLIEISHIPSDCVHNGHTFWIKTRSASEQAELIAFLAQHSIQAVFHYVPLHSAPGGERFGRFCGEDLYTTSGAGRLVRLPLFFEFEQAARVVQVVGSFYGADLEG
jgi:dTDP-4-amino-4,6-dideoxygalactose transaminase